MGLKTVVVDRKEYLELQHKVGAQEQELRKLREFQRVIMTEYYHSGLEVTNWHLNDSLEPLDNLIDYALQDAAAIDQPDKTKKPDENSGEQMFCDSCGRLNWSQHADTCYCHEPKFIHKSYENYMISNSLKELGLKRR